MIKELIDGFKPSGYDVLFEDFELDGDRRIVHLQELTSLFENKLDDIDSDEYEQYYADYSALFDFLKSPQFHDKLLTLLVEKTDTHPIHFK